MSGRNGDCPRAFTLVELLVVIALLAVAATVIVPRMGRSIGQRGLVEAAYRLERTARTVRELAISRRQVCAVDLDLDAGAYGVAMASSSGEVNAVQASWLKQERLPDGVRFGRVQLADGRVMTDGTQRILFQPDGTSSGAVVQLVAQGGQYLVAISPQNGRAKAGASEEEIKTSGQIDLGD